MRLSDKKGDDLLSGHKSVANTLRTILYNTGKSGDRRKLLNSENIVSV